MLSTVAVAEDPSLNTHTPKDVPVTIKAPSANTGNENF